MFELFEKNKIIAAVSSDEDFINAINSKTDIIFMLKANILTIKNNISLAHKENKKVFVHIDMAEGIGKDKYGIILLNELEADGVISTRNNLIKIANETGLLSIQRIFILDSHSIEVSIESIKASKPNMIEIMPGIMPKIIKLFKDKLNIPIIAGGLITNKEEAVETINSGASAVSTTNEILWKQQ